MSGEASPVQQEPFTPVDDVQDGTPQPSESQAPTEEVASPGDPDGQASAGLESESVTDPAERVRQLEVELASLRAEHDTVRSQYMRIAADFDNFRKRQSRDQDDLRLQITCSTLSEILPVVDNFDRARQQLAPQSEEAQGLHRSYQALYEQLVKVFKQLGVAPMRVEGEPFDPKLHEAVLREPSDQFAEDVVVEELQRGYQLDGRVLRHALVKVSMGPGPATPSASQPAQDDKSTGEDAH
ncbi:nucleotide exchange factor GrpE [Synechococcus sp. CS-1325]|uniref:nucleotide exchange factor GrpE n=1 Tax=unclassified Synechococcus TaxID=2626047 RepID=UPI000DB8576B|nr:MULTISPECIES: nucleotide exchange factor GrpE [unclassified Synechococcus]MCT0199163.1 nucleotide exchange factor GrpE [Synechococcus sp. CS-1325]MCT0214658.1 nucleotide exchange factor GrpE [Synechococcus sp. CS-1326]MCT0233992.1 nucleotide exchange factor GrpE [Synechococcus sp. CS-1327]PZU96589.1 MAG: nucleotide exchange factor GrpE [Cyanobium sp.]